MNIKQIKTLYIVAGSAGEIGTEYCKALSNRGSNTIAIIRNKQPSIDSKNINFIKCDLTSSESISDSFKKVDLGKYSRIVFLHTIGSDKFDPRGYPNVQKMQTIDSDVYDTNVNTFKYPLRYLLEAIHNINTKSDKNIELKLVLLGGIPDKFTPFVIESFCEAKNLCRQYIRSAIELNPDRVCGLIVNISSTITKSALKVRPNADLTYWLTPEEVVNQSIKSVISNSSGYNEIEIYKKSPEFQEGYYEDNKALYNKWSRETGIK